VACRGRNDAARISRSLLQIEVASMTGRLGALATSPHIDSPAPWPQREQVQRDCEQHHEMDVHDALYRVAVHVPVGFLTPRRSVKWRFVGTKTP
jgi:hypothetical protein